VNRKCLKHGLFTHPPENKEGRKRRMFITDIDLAAVSLKLKSDKSLRMQIFK